MREGVREGGSEGGAREYGSTGGHGSSVVCVSEVLGSDGIVRWFVGWLVRWFVGSLVGWLVGWLDVRTAIDEDFGDPKHTVARCPV